MIGRTLSHYKILSEISRGGMGIVYRALDVKLNREIALKVLPPELVSDEERKRRFVIEAQSAASLKHPNIAVIHEIDEVEGVTFIAMELIDGQKLSDILQNERLPLHRVLAIAIEVSEGLRTAHRHGIIHRDLKPSNIMVGEDGHAKVIDFGLAKLVEPLAGPSSEAATAARGETETGQILGTVFYMSPEQARGDLVDARSDLFSFGATLYEMASGAKPFDGKTSAAVFDAILNRQPASPRDLNPDLPHALERIISRLLEKDPQHRFASAEELLKALQKLQQVPTALGIPLRWLRRPRVAVPLALLVAATGFLAVRWFQHASMAQWAREQAIPEILRLVEEEDFTSAFDVASEVERYLPDDPVLVKLWPDFSRTVSVETIPEGAEVLYKAYSTDEAEWRTLGPSPIAGARLPRDFFRWKFEKEGYQTFETAGPSRGNDVTFRRVLDAVDSVPADMVRVQGANRYLLLLTGLEHLETPELEDYLIDRFEVTNQRFKEFVDSRGYQNPNFWKHEFVKDGRVMSWEEAMTELVDATGRPGPATWELGDYFDGQDDYPVRGVSWYEAAAYAEFVGKRLPTVHHWARAAATHLSSWIVPLSNFGGHGPAPAGKHGGLGRYGTYDMAGNVKEWCWNPSDGRRYILGGAWSEPTYMFNDPDAQSPFERQPTYGFRCMKSLSDRPLPKATIDPILLPHRDFAAIEPISDGVFEIYKRLFSYDKIPLNAEVEKIDESAEHWRLEKVSLDAAYGNERLSAYLFVPKGVDPPHQTVVYFPGSGVIYQSSSENLDVTDASANSSTQGGIGGIDFLIKSGRAVLFPIYRGTYERGDELRSDCPERTSFYRDHMIMWVKDLGRALDYLESRGDFGDRFALYGFSWGAALGAILPALEERLAVAVLVAGGYFLQETFPEVDQPTYAPRVTIPVLMLNGRFDFFFPVETSQKYMLDMLGTPPDDKRLIVYESGHSVPRTEGIKEALNWLDRYLGPVE